MTRRRRNEKGCQNASPHIGVVGARLQGVEAVYLAKAAGYRVTLIDHDPEAPALVLADHAHVFDVCKDDRRLRQVLDGVDCILPATESQATLDFLAEITHDAGVIFLHDADAYAVSSSKARSNAFFNNHRIPIPAKWPACDFPVIVKPSGASGSHGVIIVPNRSALDHTLPAHEARYGELVIERYHDGPSLSLEFIAREGTGRAYLTTDLEFDAHFDCKRVHAPARLPLAMHRTLEAIGQKIAYHLGLNGFMDVEVMADPETGTLVVLEIDARFPSQTPMTVYHASGINLLQEWVNAQVLDRPHRPAKARPGCALLEHVAVKNLCLEVIGETRLMPWGTVRVWPNATFFGADVAITDYEDSPEAFKSTLIFTGNDWPQVAEKRERCIEQIMTALKLTSFSDPGPPSIPSY